MVWLYIQNYSSRICEFSVRECMTVYGGIKTKVHRGTSIYYVNILKGWVQKMAIFAVQGGFQLLDLIITELKSHMTCYYNSMPPLIG